MQLFSFVAVNAATGAVLPGATVLVYVANTSSLASIFNAAGGAISNPTTTNVNGQVAFQAANGVYDIQVTSGSYVAPLIQAVQLFDLRAVSSNNILSYAGADPTGTSDSTSAYLNAVAQSQTTGSPLYIPAGRYRINGGAAINLANSQTQGFMTYGDGRGRSILDFSSATNSPNLSFTCTIASHNYTGDGVTTTFSYPGGVSWPFGVRKVTVGATTYNWGTANLTNNVGAGTFTISPTPGVGVAIVAFPALDNDRLKLRDLGIVGSTTGVLCALGTSDLTNADSVNIPDFDAVDFLNASSAGTATALQINAVYGGKFKIVCDCGYGAFAALDMRQSQFNDFEGSFGTANFGVIMRDGTNEGNKFNAPDFENTVICVEAASGNIVSNLFATGEWGYSSAGYNDVAGSNNVIDTPNLNYSSPATAAGFVSGRGTGVLVRFNPATFGISPPTVTLVSGGTPYTNATGFNMTLYLTGGVSGGSPIVTVGGFNFPYVGGVGHRLSPGQMLGVSGFSTVPTAIIIFDWS